MSKNELPNQCPFCHSSDNGHESPEALKSHITLFHPEVDIQKDPKTQHIITKDSKELS